MTALVPVIASLFALLWGIFHYTRGTHYRGGGWASEPPAMCGPPSPPPKPGAVWMGDGWMWQGGGEA